MPDSLPAMLLTFWNSADYHIRAAVAKEDIQSHFKEGPGNITEVKLMNGFGFIEYDNALDARDVVPGMQALHPLLARICLHAFYSLPYVFSLMPSISRDSSI